MDWESQCESALMISIPYLSEDMDCTNWSESDLDEQEVGCTLAPLELKHHPPPSFHIILTALPSPPFPSLITLTPLPLSLISPSLLTYHITPLLHLTWHICTLTPLPLSPTLPPLTPSQCRSKLPRKPKKCVVSSLH